MYTFLHTPLSDHPIYPEILHRLTTTTTNTTAPATTAAATVGTSDNNNNIFPDVGTGFGHELRRLKADGVPGCNMRAMDISTELWELGYTLFRDRERLGVEFVPADLVASPPSPTSPSPPSPAADAGRDGDGDSGETGEAAEAAESLLGNLNVQQVDIIHVGSFFHLFDWDRQARALERLMRLTTTTTTPGGERRSGSESESGAGEGALTGAGALIVGHQTGRVPAKATMIRGESRFYHDTDSWRRLFTEAGEATGTSWAIEVEVGLHDTLGFQQEDFLWMGPYARALRFVARRIA